MSEGCDDRRLRIYDAENGLLLFEPFEIHSDWIRSVAWSPDGQRYVFDNSPAYLKSRFQPAYIES
jgi:WD40 repeat protein